MEEIRSTRVYMGDVVAAEAAPELQAECAIMGHLFSGVETYRFCFYCGVRIL